MELKPFSWPSTRYMMEPRITTSASTTIMNMLIFFAADRKAEPRKLISVRKWVSLKTRKILNNLNARSTSSDWAPVKNILRYMGIIVSRSINPRNPSAYLKGNFTVVSLKKYSIVKRMVKNHSMMRNTVPYFAWYEGTLSSITTMMLLNMQT